MLNKIKAFSFFYYAGSIKVSFHVTKIIIYYLLNEKKYFKINGIRTFFSFEIVKWKNKIRIKKFQDGSWWKKV